MFPVQSLQLVVFSSPLDYLEVLAAFLSSFFYFLLPKNPVFYFYSGFTSSLSITLSSSTSFFVKAA